MANWDTVSPVVVRQGASAILTFFGTDLFDAEWSASTVCIGVFDGVHRGHLKVIQTAVETARQHGEPCVLLTFDRHPAWILAPQRVPLAVATLSQNLEQFALAGVDVAVVVPFDAQTAKTEASSFLEETLVKKLKASRLVVGHDFALGKDRVGTPEWLAQKIETDVVPPFQMDQHRVSSSEIRSAVTRGDMELANRLLGRPFSVRGIVHQGEKLGRTLGYPTLNLALSTRQVLPVDGVYSGFAITRIGRFEAAISIGNKPTLQGRDQTTEAHLIDYPAEEIYGSVVDIAITHKLRDQRKFDNLDALKSQMALDVEAVRQMAKK